MKVIVKIVVSSAKQRGVGDHLSEVKGLRPRTTFVSLTEAAITDIVT
jgi:hypothetical protein